VLAEIGTISPDDAFAAVTAPDQVVSSYGVALEKPGPLLGGTGFRLGYACAPQPIIEAMMKIHQYGILCAPITSQEAALEAIRHGEPDVERMRREYELRRNFISRAFEELDLPCHRPNGSFYVFPDIRSTGLTSREFAHRLLQEKRVAAVPGDAFGPGGEGFVRIALEVKILWIDEPAKRQNAQSINLRFGTGEIDLLGREQKARIEMGDGHALAFRVRGVEGKCKVRIPQVDQIQKRPPPDRIGVIDADDDLIHDVSDREHREQHRDQKQSSGQSRSSSVHSHSTCH
jgi:hypothetical protein